MLLAIVEFWTIIFIDHPVGTAWAHIPLLALLDNTLLLTVTLTVDAEPFTEGKIVSASAPLFMLRTWSIFATAFMAAAGAI
jgi:hypothetical protein